MSEEKMTPELAAELIDFALNPEFLTFILDEADRRYQSKLQKQPFVFGAAVTVGYYGREIKGYADAEHRCELAAQDMLRAEKERDELRAELAAAKADLDRHKRAIDMARTTLEYVGNWGNDPTSVAIARNCEKGLEEISRILEGKE